MMPDTRRFCRACGLPLARRDGERPDRWLKRQTCNHSCGAIMRRSNQAERLGHKESPSDPPPSKEWPAWMAATKPFAEHEL